MVPCRPHGLGFIYSPSVCSFVRISGEYLRLNRNMLAGFVSSFTISSLVAQALSEQEHHANTTYTLVADYAIFFGVFGGLTFFSNRRRYGRGGWERGNLRQHLLRFVGSLGIGEVAYSVSRWTLHYYFLEAGYDPYAASLVAHAASSAIYFTVVNLSMRVTRAYKQ